MATTEGFYRVPRKVEMSQKDFDAIKKMGRGRAATRIVELMVAGKMTVAEAGRVYVALDEAGCFETEPTRPRERPASQWSRKSLDRLLSVVRG